MKKILGAVFIVIVLIGTLIGICGFLFKNMAAENHEEKLDTQREMDIVVASEERDRLEELFDDKYNGYPDYYGGF